MKHYNLEQRNMNIMLSCILVSEQKNWTPRIEQRAQNIRILSSLESNPSEPLTFGAAVLTITTNRPSNLNFECREYLRCAYSPFQHATLNNINSYFALLTQNIISKQLY